MKKLFIAASLAAALAGCASMSSGPAPATMKNGMLVDAKGMTLYTFDRDVAGSGKSACMGDCAKKWPALKAKDSDMAMGDFSTVAAADGGKQWAYKGKPLYTWPEDQAPGDKYGDNYNKVWHIVR